MVPLESGASRARWAWAAPASLVGAVLSVGLVAQPKVDRPPSPKLAALGKAPHLVTFEPQTAEQLDRVLEQVWLPADRAGHVPNLVPSVFPADMEVLEPAARKRTFIRSILPYLLEVNRRIAGERRALVRIADRLARGDPLYPIEKALLRSLGSRYRAPGREGGESAQVAELLRRVDVVPPSLGLAQAAVESGWGSSRLATRASSIFGQSVRQPEGERLRYARFLHLGEAVEAYVRNLNSFRPYEKFRALRAHMRRQGKDVDGWALAQGLIPYSERREAYVEAVREIMRTNRFSVLSTAELKAVRAGFLAAVLAADGPALAGQDAFEAEGA